MLAKEDEDSTEIDVDDEEADDKSPEEGKINIFVLYSIEIFMQASNTMCYSLERILCRIK